MAVLVARVGRGEESCRAGSCVRNSVLTVLYAYMACCLFKEKCFQLQRRGRSLGSHFTGKDLGLVILAEEVIVIMVVTVVTTIVLELYTFAFTYANDYTVEDRAKVLADCKETPVDEAVTPRKLYVLALLSPNTCCKL